MPSVTVDLADLETLVMTTGAIKVIEGAISQRKSDPFVREHLDFTAAHDRLASAMRNARRAEAGTLVPWDGELTDEEITKLRQIEASSMMIYHEPIHTERAGMNEINSLSAKGCVIIGTYAESVLWAGAAALESRPKGFAVRITDRGREKLAMLDAANEVCHSLQTAADLCGND